MFLRCTFTVPSVRPICSRTMPVGESFRDETEHLEALHAGAAQADGSGDRIEESAVELVEFGDYECPYCRKAHSIVKRLKQRFDHRLDFRFVVADSSIRAACGRGRGERAVASRGGGI